MMLCEIVGHAIASIGHPSLDGSRLALCQKLNADGQSDGSPPSVAVDALGAGMHQKVLVTTDGQAAQEILGDPASPARNAILALVDEPPSAVSAA